MLTIWPLKCNVEQWINNLKGLEIMVRENAFFEEIQEFDQDIENFFDFDELEEQLQSQLEKELTDLEFLKSEKEKIGNPDNLGNVIMDVVWEQFMNQIAVTAGEDFIREMEGFILI